MKKRKMKPLNERKIFIFLFDFFIRVSYIEMKNTRKKLLLHFPVDFF